MCWFVRYMSNCCYHLVYNVPFCVGVCADLVAFNTHPSRYDRLDIVPVCPNPRTQTFMVNTYCYRCWYKVTRRNYLDPLDPRIVHKIEGDVKLDELTWYVDGMPVNEHFVTNFREVNWNPDEGVVGEANYDQNPASSTGPAPLPPPISERNPLRISLLGKRKAPPTPPTPRNETETPGPAPAQTDDILPDSPPRRRLFTTIPSRHTPKLLIIPHTGRITQTQTAIQSPTLSLDTTDPDLTTSLASGIFARSSRQNLCAIRDSPLDPSKGAKTVAETRTRLESQGKSVSAGLKGGLRFKAARTRRAPVTTEGSAGSASSEGRVGVEGDGGLAKELQEMQER